MDIDFEQIRQAAYRTLHLIFIKSIGSGAYTIVPSEKEGGRPVLADYLSFHHHQEKIRVKDAGSNIVYLLSPEQYKQSLLETMLKNDPGLAGKLRNWFPFLWGEETEDERERYASVLRQLKKLAEIFEDGDGITGMLSAREKSDTSEEK